MVLSHFSLICFVLFALNQFFISTHVFMNCLFYILKSQSLYHSLLQICTGCFIWTERKLNFSFYLSTKSRSTRVYPSLFPSYECSDTWTYGGMTSLEEVFDYKWDDSWKASRQNNSARFRWWSEIKNCLTVFSCKAETICIIDLQLYFCPWTTYFCCLTCWYSELFNTNRLYIFKIYTSIPCFCNTILFECSTSATNLSFNLSKLQAYQWAKLQVCGTSPASTERGGQWQAMFSGPRFCSKNNCVHIVFF